MSHKTTTKVCYVVELKRSWLANPIPNASARQSPSHTARRLIIKTIEQQVKRSGAPSPTTAAAQSSVVAYRVVAALLTEALDQTIDIHQRPSWHLELPVDAAAMRVA